MPIIDIVLGRLFTLSIAGVSTLGLIISVTALIVYLSLYCLYPQMMRMSVAAFASSFSSAQFGSSSSTIAKEIVSTDTDKSIYAYGETVHLLINDQNLGPAFTLTKDEIMSYAGRDPALDCQPISYLYFDVLAGDYTKNITDYSQIISLKDKALNVLEPYDKSTFVVGCPNMTPIYQQIQNVTLDNNHVIFNSIGPSNSSTLQGNLHKVYSDIQKLYYNFDIQKEYSKGPNETFPPYSGTPLPIGSYTIVAYTMSGQISKPIKIEIVNQEQVQGLFLNNLILPIGTGAAVAGIVAFVTLKRRKNRR